MGDIAATLYIHSARLATALSHYVAKPLTRSSSTVISVVIRAMDSSR